MDLCRCGLGYVSGGRTASACRARPSDPGASPGSASSATTSGENYRGFRVDEVLIRPALEVGLGRRSASGHGDRSGGRKAQVVEDLPDDRRTLDDGDDLRPPTTAELCIGGIKRSCDRRGRRAMFLAVLFMHVAAWTRGGKEANRE